MHCRGDINRIPWSLGEGAVAGVMAVLISVLISVSGSGKDESTVKRYYFYVRCYAFDVYAFDV